MVDIDYKFEFIRFFVGSMGTMFYFLVIKYPFLKSDLDNPQKNSNAIPNNKFALILFFFINSLYDLDDPQKNSNAIPNNKVALVFYCFIGGLIPCFMDTTHLYGWFIEGFSLRLTLSFFWSLTIYIDRSKGVRKK